MFETKLCACGCGQPAPLAKKTSTALGWIKGQPLQYVHNHHMRGKYASVEERLKNFKVDSVTGCHVWQGSTVAGYGHLYVDGKLKLAHRVSWELAKGEIPEGLFVLHKCDNPPCINPEHLFAGTHEDNMKDMDAKGRRRSRGSAIPIDKIEAAIVYWLTGQGTQEQAASFYGLSRPVVSNYYRLVWKENYHL